MSVGLKFLPMVRAVRAGLVECMDPLKVQVFPGDPQGTYEKNGSAWVASTKDRPEVDQLGADEDDHKETVTITVTVSCYAESSESHMKAYTDAEDRCVAMLNAYRGWLGGNKTLKGADDVPTCDFLVIEEVEPRTSPADKGWVIEWDLTIVATVYPTVI